MPDEAGPLNFVPCPVNNLFNGPGLMLAQYNLKKDIILPEEYNVILEKLQNSLSVKERLNLFLEVSLFDIFPIKKPFSIQVPSYAIVKIEHMRNVEYLIMRYKFCGLMMIPPDLVNPFSNAFFFMRSFGFNDNNRDTVYKQDNIPAVCICAVGILPFVSNVEFITRDILKINQLDIYFAPLALMVNTRLSFEVPQNIAIAFNGRVHILQIFDNVLCFSFIYNPGIEPYELF